MLQEEIKAKKELLLNIIKDSTYQPMKMKELAGLLQVPKEKREELRFVLESMIADGSLTTDTKGRYRAAGSEIQTGVFCGTSRGFGFVTIEGMAEDIFIPESETNGALDRDVVQIQILSEKSGPRKEGKIVTVVERNSKDVVGTFQQKKTYGFVIPDNQKFGSDIFISGEHTMGAIEGNKVVVRLIDYGTASKSPEGEIIELLGHINDPGTDVLTVIKASGLPTEFPDEVLHSLAKIPQEISEQERNGRLDLRELLTVTIDGEDAKDLDDAITLKKENGIYQLGVHIADVSHYVKEGSPLDTEALKRGTSVYLIDRVIPMLPHQLSNGICSLNEGCDRLALSCLMEIDENGTVLGHHLAETVIRVDRRMTYTSVSKILEDRDPEECAKYQDFIDLFECMAQLAGILREKRRKRGSINFDFPESKIKLNPAGKPLEICPYERNKATNLIEDFMLVTNETIAEDFYWQELPFVYRSHEQPDTEKIQKLSVLIHNFGYHIKTGREEIHPKELQKLLVKIEDSPEEALISRLTLRSMKQARYTTDCTGHFGLAARYYCHFTSPIRRYPDLQIHRIIKENLQGAFNEARISHYETILPEVAKQASRTERRAEEAEREVEKLKKVEYMSQFLGETFEGIVSGVTSWGMYVELPNTVEGMIRVSDLTDDYYIFNEEHYTLTGERTKREFKLGQRIQVMVAGTDKLLRTIDFLPAIG